MSNDSSAPVPGGSSPIKGAQLIPSPDDTADENTRLAEFGYKQRLDRSIGRLASFAIGFSTISATTAVFSSFGAGYFTAGGPFVWTLLIAVVVFAVWALISADLAAKIPLAGYAYQWTSRINGSTLGWFTGFAAIIGWVSGMTGVAYTFAGYIGSVFDWNETPAEQIWLTVAVIVICMLINAYGVRLTTMINNIGVSLELVVTVAATLIVGILAFVVPEHRQPVSVLFTGGTTDGSYAAAWLAAAIGPFFGLIGVEASADVAEETKRARRVIPRTMFSALIISSIIELLMYIVYVLAIRNPDAVAANQGAPIGEIIAEQAGPVFSKVVVAVALTNIFVCLLSNMLLATRLTYSLSRDNMLPFSRQLRTVSPKHRSPVAAVFVTAIVAIALTLSALADATAFTYFLGICTLAFFTVYVLQTAGLIAGHRKGRIPIAEHGTFDLGRSRMPIYAIGLIMFLVVEAGLLFLPQFAGDGWVFLGVMAVAGIWFFAGIRPRLKKGEAGPLYASTHPWEFEDSPATGTIGRAVEANPSQPAR
jgi:amino acid transporter